jgi:hypothetical protein
MPAVSRAARVRRRRSPLTAACLEVLESRRLLAGVTVTGPADHFQFETGPQTLDYTFDQNASVAANAIQLTNLTTGADASSQLARTTADGTAALSYQVSHTDQDGTAGALDRGNYEAILNGDLVTASGEPMAADDVSSFFFQPGDANHDRVVNIDDYSAIDNNASGAGGSLTGYSNGDFNYADNVNIDDYSIIDQWMGTALQPPPTAPNTLNASGGPNLIDLQWTVPDGETPDGFGVWRSTDGGATFTFLQFVADGTARSWRDSGLLDGTKYVYRVRAHTADGGYSETTNKASAVTSLPPPTNVQVTNVTGTSLTLTWQPQTTMATGYQIYTVDPQGNLQLIGTAGASATSFEVSNLTEATQYSFVVQANNANSGQSSGLAAPANGPVTTPHEPTAETTTVYGGGGDIPGYVTMEWDGGQEVDSETLEPVSDSTTRYTDGDLTLKLGSLPRHTYAWSQFRVEGWVLAEQPIPTVTCTAGGTSLTPSPVFTYTHEWRGQQHFINYGWSFNLPAAEADGAKHQGDEFEVTITGKGFGTDPKAGNSWYIGLAGVKTILPFVSVSGQYYVGEGDSATLRVSRTGQGTLLDEPMTVSLYSFTDFPERASQGTDFECPLSVTIPKGMTATEIKFDALVDDEQEPDEVAEIKVRSRSDYGFAKAADGNSLPAHVVIEDRDACDGLGALLSQLRDENLLYLQEIAPLLKRSTILAMSAKAYQNVADQANAANSSGTALEQLVSLTDAADAGTFVGGVIANLINDTQAPSSEAAAAEIVAEAMGLRAALAAYAGPALIAYGIGKWFGNALIKIEDVNSMAQALDALSVAETGAFRESVTLTQNVNTATQDGLDIGNDMDQLAAAELAGTCSQADCASRARQYLDRLRALRASHQVRRQEWDGLSAELSRFDAALEEMGRHLKPVSP